MNFKFYADNTNQLFWIKILRNCYEIFIIFSGIPE